MNKEQAQAETAALNKFANKRYQKCCFCNGTGNKYQPNYGDPAMGYHIAGKCPNCKNTGQESLNK